MKKTGLLILSFSFFLTRISGQQLPLFTQYREYHALINPATINSDYFLNQYDLSFGLSGRTQWTGLDRGPQTQVFRGEYIWNNGNTFSPVFGGYLMNDQTGPTGMRSATARVAVVASDDVAHRGFSAGLNIGASQFRFNAGDVYLRQPDRLAIEDYRQTYPDIAIGVFGYTSFSSQGTDDNIVYAGLSVPQILGGNVHWKTTTSEFALQRVPHFYGLVGYYKALPSIAEGSFFEASAWVKYVANTPIHLDYNARYQMGEYISLGVGYSTSQILHSELGFQIGKLMEWQNKNAKIGYSFDHAFSSLAPYFGSSHEIHLSFTLDSKHRY